jgi:hypothetical protein
VKEKVNNTLHRELSATNNILLLISPYQIHFMACCLTSSSTFILGKLATLVWTWGLRMWRTGEW